MHFPPIEELLEWPAIFLKDTPFEVNKIVLLMWASVLIVFLMFYVAGKRYNSGNLVPSGLQTIVESGVEFVRKDIILQTIGPQGLAWTPFLVTMFFFIFITNIWEVIPGIQMPVNARMALPAFLALLVWAIFNF
ncbi:MAG TPA: F0F1 ATP synthase subunit A, partial [Acidimicrobiales bacterium]